MDNSRVMLAAGLALIGLWSWFSVDASVDATDRSAELSDLSTTYLEVADTSESNQAESHNAAYATDDSGRAHFHAHGDAICASGCAPSNHPTDEISYKRFCGLLEQFAAGPLDGSNYALESLLFYGPQSAAHLKTYANQPDAIAAERAPSGEQLAFLEHQLARTAVRVAIRVVDEHGIVRAELPPTRVPLDRRHVFELDENNIQPMVVSGTVKRVGLEHLWTRL